MRKWNWYRESDAPQGVPVFDFKLLDRNVLKDTLAKSGFFYLKNFGIEEKLFSSLISITRDFFDAGQSIKTKMIAPSLPLRGFSPLKSENLARLVKEGDYPDLCMKYTWGSQKNLYPNEKFHRIWTRYYRRLNGVAQSLLLAISEVLESETLCDSQDWNKIIHGESMVRHLFYPELNDSQELSMAPHSDLGSVTLLYQTPAANGHIALEADLDGKFVSVPAIRGTLVVNFGDVLAHITGGKVKATRHRVVHSPSSCEGCERTSTICFYMPDRQFNLRKFSGSDFGHSFGDGISTFGDLVDKDGKAYAGKE
jgi:isopenicillin N synthase-like dioxygenase